MKNIYKLNEIRNGHTLYASKTSLEFEQIASFVKDNPTEVVIIDLNGNWFGMDEDKNFHDKLEEELNQK